MKKWIRKKSVIGYFVSALVVVGLNLLAWGSTSFCDFYIANIFPIWVSTYGRITGVFPFSVGEFMLIAGCVLVLLMAVVTLLFVIVKLWEWSKRNKDGKGVCRKVVGLCKGYATFFAWTVLAVCVVMTLNCFILYHASTFSEKYFGQLPSSEEFTFDELIAVRNLVVDRCNELSLVVERDANGDIIYDGDLEADAIGMMQALGEHYPQLDGYYPRPKPLLTSDFFCQQYMQGYYFPFSMEANYNTVMCFMNKPATLCHELSHLRGYIYEDEANFIAFLACISSDDIIYEYSGYLSVLYYLDNDFYRGVGGDAELYYAQPSITQQVHVDNTFVTQEEWDRINGTALIDTEVVKEVSDNLVDTSLKLNGVEDGKVSYSRVVRLLLQYYRSQGKI